MRPSADNIAQTLQIRKGVLSIMPGKAALRRQRNDIGASPAAGAF
jgi:hypothetical protein